MVTTEHTAPVGHLAIRRAISPDWSGSIERHEFTCGWYFDATKEELIAAGIAEASWFSDCPRVTDRRGRTRILRRKKLIVDGRRIETCLNHHDNLTFHLYIHRTDEEYRAYREMETEVDRRKRQAEYQAERDAEDATKTPAEWKEEAIKKLNMFGWPFVGGLVTGRVMNVSDEDYQTLRDLWVQLILAVRNARVIVLNRPAPPMLRRVK